MNTDKLESDVQSLINTAIQKHQLGNLVEAESIYKQVIQTQTDATGSDSLENQYYLTVLTNLGHVLQEQGKLDEAAAAYNQALKLQPDAAVYNDLGNVLQEQGRLDEAVASYHHALKLQPEFFYAYKNLGNMLHKQNKLDEAVASYHHALKVKPDFAPAKFSVCISQLPIIYSSFDEIQLRRDRYQQHLQELADTYAEANQKEREKATEAVGTTQPFYLAYQGLNDRPLQQIYGELISQLMSSRYPQWSQPPALANLAANEKIRIGIVSRFFYDHSNWKMPIQGWVENLDKNEFELFGYHTGLIQDRVTAKAAKAFVKFIRAPLSIEKWCEVIRQDQLHILIFPEFGMDPITVILGCLRLAPIQITSWGHPDTSGLPTIDYYLSSDLMEPEDAQDHYTERLVRLPNLSIYYTPLEIKPKAVCKRDIGIEDNEVMFWCCQSLYKYLPQHDDVFPRIAQELSSCKFVFIIHTSEQITDIFRQRLDYAFSEFGLNYKDHCIFIPRLDATTFAGVAAIADVFLDSIGWSGCNSTLESIAHNVPVVTLPGDLMRGRHTMAMLKMMGIQELIAASKDDYVEIALRLGQDPQYRQHISRQVAENKHKLYGDLEPIAALENFFRNVVYKNYGKSVSRPTVSETHQHSAPHPQANLLAQAEQTYRKMLETQPNHPDALHGLGVVAHQLGQYHAAQEWLSAAIRVQPESFKAWFSLGNLRQHRGQLSDAEEAYRQALALQPDTAAVYNNLGYVLQQQGKWDEAFASYQRALEIQPNFAEADVNLGNALHAQGKLSIEQQARYAAANYMLGVTQQKKGDLTTAVAYYRQAITMQPDLAIAHYNLGMALQKQGQLEEAFTCYQQALQLNPSNAEVYNHLEKIYREV